MSKRFLFAFAAAALACSAETTVIQNATSWTMGKAGKFVGSVVVVDGKITEVMDQKEKGQLQ